MDLLNWFPSNSFFKFVYFLHTRISCCMLKVIRRKLCKMLSHFKENNKVSNPYNFIFALTLVSNFKEGNVNICHEEDIIVS